MSKRPEVLLAILELVRTSEDAGVAACGEDAVVLDRAIARQVEAQKALYRLLLPGIPGITVVTEKLSTGKIRFQTRCSCGRMGAVYSTLQEALGDVTGCPDCYPPEVAS